MIRSFLIVCMLSHQLFAQAILPYSADIGDPKLKGSHQYDPQKQEFILEGGGSNIWFNKDEFYYKFDSLEGDFILTARVELIGQGNDPHRKAGWMVRESTGEESAHVSAVIHGDGLTSMQWRALRGAYMRSPEDEISAPKKGYTLLQLERKQNTFIMRAAIKGEPLQEIGRNTMKNLSGKVLAGLFITSHNSDVKEKARAWNVRIDKPVPEDYNPYEQGFLGCRLEIMDVFTQDRQVIFEKEDRFEAPNWMPDGQHLLFNRNGRLYTIDTNGDNMTELETGSADANNNDHGISFNGKMIALSSSHNDQLEGGSSAVYVVSLEGGEPRLVTPKTPSYWHGWNPNNREVVYVAKRNPEDPYNIFKADIRTQEESQLTYFTNGHTDGPEYSPDGKFIYYNGSQTGTMQIWRMKPDGSDKEQLTFDERNKWFPHISPNGKWMVFLSFPTSVAPGDHPSYKRVYLHLMPVNGGPSKVIAYLYGGQGTINVPSWSPDNRRIAFVSNSGKK